MNISDWKFCKCRSGQKVPYPHNWQNLPLDLNEIPVGDNYGVLTGVHSGILAIDFDGFWALDWWNDAGFEPLPATIGWTSGRPGRAQFAYRVPIEAYDLLKTVKFNNGLKKPDNEGIEFRWNGCQSVLPPSVHPDTGLPYEWLGDTTECAELPIEVIEFIYEVTKPYEAPQKNIADITDSNQDPDQQVKDLVDVMETFKRYFPTLQYDDWIRTTFSCMRHVGTTYGEVIMSTFYPEQKQGEYSKLASKFSSEHRPPGIGSLIEKIRTQNPYFRKNKNNAFVKQLLDKYKGKSKE